ncbi:uncharacterized protein SPAPADRAFT_138006 [Spathaspora passalidarum NRRL Y-27907]|uniref:Uncharacterized protein n=1 Tax=Spathaspora passalidarum (strain NRRL Y-27907 / 11-Y1) TaxID=619300 RepID=G3AN53_SPAPN|nr:uncharacterized protein SPAPADRAFT_138006 [Spathaspora passalidarum NRRL Y-27907]EGW31896.1 hypothetical protein SPAPADRAFT_138006 [Spathaspora passalidarum NRRL Y-27907]
MLTTKIIRCSTLCITRIGITRPFSSSIPLSKSPFRTSDNQIDTGDISTENNPWSPTLYSDSIYVQEPKKFTKTKLPWYYRLSYSPLYEAPSAKYVSLLKRMTIGFTILGMYGSKLLLDSTQLEDIYAYTVALMSMAPTAIVQYKTRDYVTRIFRLYDKNKPQTLENLVSDEKLIMEKLNFTGNTTYNELLDISNSKTLKLTPKNKQNWMMPYSTWEEIEPESQTKRSYYIEDNIGGLKMDRIWGKVEKQSGVNNGRSDWEDSK